MMVLLYLAAGLALGHGLVLLLVMGLSAAPLALASWLAAAVILFGNYRRLNSPISPRGLSLTMESPAQS